MRTWILRITGILLIMAAIGGFVIAVAGMISIWQIKPQVISSVQSNLDLLNKTLETTSEGLAITKDSLDGAKASLQAMQSTLQTTSKTMQSTEPLITSMSDLAAQDLPAAVLTAQNSLDTAAESAQVVDTVLRALNFLPGINYNPNTPLATALEELSTNLDNLPETFIVMESNLRDTGHNLQIIQVDLVLMIDALRQIEASLMKSENVIASYQDSVTQVNNQIVKLSDSTPKLVNGFSIGSTVFLAWFMIAQLGLFTQGWQLLESPTRQRPTKPKENTPQSKKVASTPDHPDKTT
ncbi:MAG TPA: hypothetical protein VLM80_10415 [Anaerolineales bacterium]|nr:hypothetical protein [Anaerolineales bacterium]